MENCVAEMFTSIRQTQVQQIKRRREFRTSSLPFCPILGFLQEPQIESYDKSHYTSTGTSIHTTIQSWMSVAKVPRKWLWGSWKCTGCQTIRQNQFQPKKLCECKHRVSTTDFHRGWPKHWTYEEVEYNYYGLTGHIDAIFVPLPYFAFVLDVKTTQLQAKKSRYNWKADKVSSPNYVAQVRTYSTVLDMEFNLPIQGWVLLNVERGKPITSSRDYHMQVATWDHEKSQKWDKNLQLAIQNNKRLSELEQAIENGEKSEATKYLKRVIANRPCHDEKSYNQFMKYGFYQGVCPHLDVCSGGSNKAVYNRIMSELSKKE